VETKSVNKTERLAKVSRVLGILAVGLMITLFLISLYDMLIGGTGSGFALLSRLLLSGSILFGASSCITAMIALVKNSREGNNNETRKIATRGFALGVLPCLILPCIFSFISY
jgi:hypothetical protein